MLKKLLLILAVVFFATAAYAGEWATRNRHPSARHDWVRGDDPVFTSLTVSNDLTVGRDLYVDGDAIINETLTVITSTDTSIETTEQFWDLSGAGLGELSIPKIVGRTTGTVLPIQYGLATSCRLAIVDDEGDDAPSILFAKPDFSNSAQITADMANSAFIFNWDMFPDENDTYDLGSNTYKWQDLFLSGDAYVDGNVGIGTTSPSYKLDVNGSTMRIGEETAGSANSAIILRGTYLGTPYNSLFYSDFLGGANFAASTGNSSATVGFYTGNPSSRRMRITYGGNVGINEDSPTAKLEVNGSLFAGGVLYVEDGGNIGIGTSAPVAKLDVIGDIHVSGDLSLDNASYIKLDNSLSGDHTATGITSSMTVDANTYGIGSALHLDTDGNWIEADADAATTMPCTAIALETGTGSKKVLLNGFIRDDTWNFTVGGTVWVSTTAGTLTTTQPSGSGEQVQAVGIAINADTLYFKPDLTVIELS